MEFFGKYTNESPYRNHLTENRIYLAQAEGEPEPGFEIDKYVWITREEFEDDKFPMIEINRKEIIPELVKSEIF